MAPSKLASGNVSDETSIIVRLIRSKKHFLLSGGAGSGKTFSLVEVINAVVSDNPSSNIGCITYTNAAVNEIEDRTSHSNLYVSTIHDFLWGNIKQFQSELKETLVELINNPEQTKIKHPDNEVVGKDFFDDCDSIQYKEYLKIVKGIISHDEVIILASRMFEKYEKLCSITTNKYPFIFVDEYQDTNPLVVEILLEHLEKSTQNNVVGFFGDSMQSIYDGSVGTLDAYTKIDQPKVIEVIKQQNRRNPIKIINLANLLRDDGVIQEPSKDKSAPNMDESGIVKQGDVKFLYSVNDNLTSVREYLGWDFNNNQLVKELNLTHSLIADKANFPDLMRIYDKDKILEYIRNKIRKPLEDNEPIYDSVGKTLGQVIEHIGSPNPTPTQKAYIDDHPQVFELAKTLLYDQISRLYVDKEQLLDDKKSNVGDESKPGSNKDDLVKHLFKIENVIRLYQSNKFNEFIKMTDYSVRSVTDKVRLNEAIRSLKIQVDMKIGEVIDIAHDLGLVIKDDKLARFADEKHYLYTQVCNVKYQEFRNVFEYLEGYLPFSTQHKTKGTEFPNVLVVLDNGKWNQYNFKYLFEQNGTESVKQRTQKIFYVCCTRAKERLAVFFPNPNPQVIQTAINWFGEENVINLDDR